MTADRCLLRKETLLRREEKLFGARHSDPEKGREREGRRERERVLMIWRDLQPPFLRSK
jgi:hypothetical protein